MARLQKAATDFTQVSNRVLTDVRLSWKSKGLYAYLFSKPDNWNFSADRIKNEGSDGRESTLAGLRELEDGGYLSRKKLGNGSMIYYIGIEPKTENPIQDPKSDNPTVGKTQSGETPPISNTDIPVTKKDSNIDCVYAACEDFESFWISYPRKESKKEAEGKFSGLSQKDKQKAMTCLPLFIEYWKISKTERRYIPHAATWIGQRRWEDTLPDPSEVKSSSFKRKTPRNALTEEKDYSAGLGQFAATIT